MPKLSIITVNLNNLNGLKETVVNLFSQTYTDYEFIIVDGNSNDGSKEYIDTISDRVDSWVSEPDKGIYNAMNKGIRMATGDYVCFLNSGDAFLDSYTLEKFFDKSTENIDIYYGDVIFKKKNKKRFIPAPKTLTYPFLISNSINHQSSFIKRALFDELFLYNENLTIVSDWEFTIYAVCIKGIRTQHLDMTVSICDGTGISNIKKNQDKILNERQAVIDRLFPLFAFRVDEITTIQSKRGMQFVYIKQHAVSYRFLKWFMSLLLVFLPKHKIEK